MILLTTNDLDEQLLDFGVISLAETQKMSKIITFEKIVENNLDNDIENPLILKDNINRNLVNFFKDDDIYIYNIITNEKEALTITNLNQITHVIVVKPSERVLVKRYIITNGIYKNNYVSVAIENSNYVSVYLFPNNYVKEVIVYK
jgi:hypothetical protein